MPALPYVGAAMQVAGGINQNKQAKEAQAATNRSQDWQRYLDELGINQDYESARNWESDIDPEMTYDQATTQAKNKLDPLYKEQMTKTLEEVDFGNKSRGFYAQLPGDRLAQDRAAEVSSAQQGAVGSMANDLWQASRARSDQQKQFGVSQFGTYGNVTAPSAIGAPGSGGLSAKEVNRIARNRAIDPLGIFK